MSFSPPLLVLRSTTGAGELCRPRFPHSPPLLFCRVDYGHWLPLLSSPQHLGASRESEGPGLFGGLLGGGPQLESKGKLGADSELSPRVPEERGDPLPGQKGRMAGTPGAGPRISWPRENGVEAALGARSSLAF